VSPPGAPRVTARRALAGALLAALAVAAPARADKPKVRIETSAGSFVVQLEPERAPLTVQNFLQYAADGFYEGTVFHRVVNGFVIQGGGYTADLAPKPVRPGVPNESGNGLSNRRGTIAMARTGQPHSADAQFYVNLADNVVLDPKPTRWGYAVFGEVVEGLAVVDEIGHSATTSRGEFQDFPMKPVVIEKVVVLSGGAP
jgi:cyclophilin family peptidyl-prolyl cis-trans isomerase